MEGIYFYHQDHLGSPALITNGAGVVVTVLAYKPYGELDLDRSSGPDIIRYKYTLQEQDVETGLYNYRARYYGAASGSFTSADSLVPNSKDAGSYNRYGYVKGNPLKYTDPTGHFAVGAGYSGGFYPSSDAVEGFFEAAGHWLWVNTGLNSFETGLLPGYDFMGKGNRDPKANSNSYMDQVSKEHDKDYRINESALFTEIFNSDDSAQWAIIGADLEFIGKYYFGIITGKMFVDNFRQHGFWGGLEWIAKDLFFGGLGVWLFSFQIGLLLWSLGLKNIGRMLHYGYKKIRELGTAIGNTAWRTIHKFRKKYSEFREGSMRLMHTLQKWKWRPKFKWKKLIIKLLRL